MILIIGEILYDELPQGKRPGGAPFNVAQHVSRLGLEAEFLSRIGCDESGETLLAEVINAGLNPSFLQRDPDHSTGRVLVSLSGNGIPSYTILENVAYDHIDFSTASDKTRDPEMIYFGSLIQRSPSGRDRLQEFLAGQPASIPRLYDMNLRVGCSEAAIIIPSLEQADILKINDEELEETGSLLGSTLRGEDLISHLMANFGIASVALTEGAAGSSFFTEGRRYEAKAMALNPDQIADTVGAGDSFTSVLAWGLLQGLHPLDILHKASLLAGRMCTISGAVPQDNSFYSDILKQQGNL